MLNKPTNMTNATTTTTSEISRMKQQLIFHNLASKSRKRKQVLHEFTLSYENKQFNNYKTKIEQTLDT